LLDFLTSGILDRLPGSDVRLSEATEKADFIVVARLVALGGGNTRRNVTSYAEVQVKPSFVLKGGATHDLERQFLTVLVHETEVPPEEGMNYIFFIKNTSSCKLIIKIINKTEQNILLIKELTPFRQ